MSEVNKIQVGGDHYKTGYEHWDFVIDNQLPYLIGCATKYITRAWKKNGVQDIDKAIHYIDKIGEAFLQKRESSQEAAVDAGIVENELVDRFIRTNDMDQNQSQAIKLLCGWRDMNDLALVRNLVKTIRDELESFP